MVVFSGIGFLPLQGWDDQPWADDPATDAFVKSAVRVSEAYGEALREEGLDGPCSWLRFFAHPHDGDEVQLQVDTGRPYDCESGLVLVPQTVARLSAYDRAHLVLNLIHDAVLQLALHRGWPPEAVERVRARVLARELEFEWASPWKASPDRSTAARVRFRVADDGYGRATLEARDRTSLELVARSAPALAYGSLDNFKRSAKTLRWVKRRIEFIPRPGSPHGDHVVSMDLDLHEIHSDALDNRDEPDIDASIPPIVRAAYGSHLVDRTPGIELSLHFGFGLRVWCLPDLDGTDVSELIKREIFDRIGSGEAGISEWLEGLPVEITLGYHLPAHVEGFGDYGVRLRRTARCLSVNILREPSWPVGEVASQPVARQEVTDVVEQVMTAVRARVGKAPRRKAR